MKKRDLDRCGSFAKKNRRSRPLRAHEKRAEGQPLGVGMGVPTPRSEDVKPEARFSGLLSRFFEANES
jgi:hypothetical protein